MRLFITRNKKGWLSLHNTKPRYSKIHDAWISVNIPTPLCKDNDVFLEVTFENSPREVELKLI